MALLSAQEFFDLELMGISLLKCGLLNSFLNLNFQIKQGWSLLSTLHCLLLSGKLKTMGSRLFKKPLVEALAIRYVMVQ